MLSTFSNVIIVCSVFIFCFSVITVIGGLPLMIFRIQIGREFQILTAFGIGVLTSTLVPTISHRIGISIATSVFTLLLFSVLLYLYLSIRLFNSRLDRKFNFLILDIRKLFHFVQEYARSQLGFCFAIICTTILMLPVTRYGLTSWTATTHDYPTYVSSAAIWLDDDRSFESQQVGDFKNYMLLRSSFEKPMAMGFLTFLNVLTKLSSQQLLSIYVWIPLLLLISSLIGIVIIVIRVPRLRHFAMTVAIAGSTIPMTRLYDAQPGQIMMLALTTFGLLLFIIQIYNSKTFLNNYSGPLLAGVAFAVALGSNSTLFIGSAPTIMALLIFLLGVKRRYINLRLILKPFLLALIPFTIFSLSFLPGYIKLLRMEAAGTDGFDIPLILPTAILGLQPHLFHKFGMFETYLFWILSLILLIILLKLRGVRKPILTEVFLATTIVLNFYFLAFVYGSSAYNTHKYLTVVISIVAPILVTMFLDIVINRESVRAFFVSTVAIISFTLTLSTKVNFIPAMLWPKIQELTLPNNSINEFLSSNSLPGITATTLPKVEKIRVASIGYSIPDVPDFAAPFIVDELNFDSNKFSLIKELVPGYFLVQYKVPRFQDKILASSGSPASKHYLFGSWFAQEEWGVWSNGPNSTIVMKLPNRVTANYLKIDFYFQSFNPKESPNKLEIKINDGLKIDSFEFSELDHDPIQILLSPKEIDALNGILQITINTELYLSPSDFGSSDVRKLGVGLQEIDLELKSFLGI